jgi:hypothetical protein
MNCYLCKDAGYGEQIAHRILLNGKGVCRFHYEGSMMPATTPAAVIPAPAGIQKETAMPAKIQIDDDELKRLHAQGLSDQAIGAKLGCSGGTIRVNRFRLGLPAGPRGRRPGKGNGSVGDAMARISRKRDSVALAKAGAHLDSRLRGNDKNGDGEKVSIQLNESMVNYLWGTLPLAKRARAIEFLLSSE